MDLNTITFIVSAIVGAVTFILKFPTFYKRIFWKVYFSVVIFYGVFLMFSFYLGYILKQVSKFVSVENLKDFNQFVKSNTFDYNLGSIIYIVVLAFLIFFDFLPDIYKKLKDGEKK